MDRSKESWKKFYEKESKVYDDARFGSAGGKLFERLENEFVAELLGNVKCRNILDVATGTGRLAIHLAKCGAKVTGLDLTPEMMAKARKKARESKVHVNFIEGSAFSLPFKNNSFDHVVSIRFLHLLEREDEQKAINEMVRVLKPGGALVIEYDNLLYGGMLVPLVQLYRTLAGRRELEKFILPVLVGSRVPKLNVEEVVGAGFPLLGRLAKINPRYAHSAGKMIGRSFLKNFTSQLVVKCRKKK